jgi:hypothetical protein
MRSGNSHESGGLWMKNSNDINLQYRRGRLTCLIAASLTLPTWMIADAQARDYFNPALLNSVQPSPELRIFRLLRRKMDSCLVPIGLTSISITRKSTRVTSNFG